MRPLLLLTRPEAQARAFAARLSNLDRDHAPEIAVAPLTKIVPLAWDQSLAQGAKAVILTSANAVPAVATLAPRPAYCVGKVTAAKAAEAGFYAVAAEGGARALAALLMTKRPEGPLFYAHGREQAHDLASWLAAAGLEVRSAQVYAAEEIPWPATLWPRLKGRVVVAPLFSPRAAELFAKRLLAGLGADGVKELLLIPVAVSQSVAKNLPPPFAVHAHIAEAPEAMDDAVRAVLRQLG